MIFSAHPLVCVYVWYFFNDLAIILHEKKQLSYI